MPIYIPPRGPRGARIMIVGEAPGEKEVEDRKPFAGPSGYQLGLMLKESGIMEAECFITNFLRYRPANNNIETFITRKKKHGQVNQWEYRSGCWLSPTAIEHLTHLEAEIEEVSPNIIIPMGNVALWAVCGAWQISNHRGYIHTRPDGRKVLPTFHPAHILRFWGQRPITISDLRRAKREAISPDVEAVAQNFIIRPSYEAVIETLGRYSLRQSTGTLPLAIDIETRKGQIACIGFADSPTTAICIPFHCVESRVGYWSEEEEVDIVRLIVEVLTHPNLQAIGQNFTYDNQYIGKEWGIIVKIALDTMVMQHVLYPGLPSGSKRLGFLATMYCEQPRFWKGLGKEDSDEESKEWNERKSTQEDLWLYNCKDVAYDYEIAMAMKPLPEKQGLDFAARTQHALLEPTMTMTMRGVKQDVAMRKELSKELGIAMQETQDAIEFILGHPLNPRSTTQMQALFYDDLQQKVIRNRKTGKPTLDSDALERIGVREPVLKPLLSMMEIYRSLGVYKSTFIDALLDNGRISCSWKTSTVNTYRFASGKTSYNRGANLQNIPKADHTFAARCVKNQDGMDIVELAKLVRDAKFAKTNEEALDIIHETADKGYIRIAGNLDTGRAYHVLSLPNIRSLFLPDNDMLLADSDLDRADLQVVIWEAEDEEMKQMMREGVNIHEENAKLIGFPYAMAKRFIHGTNYGGGHRTMAMSCGLSQHEAETAQHRWFSAHPGIKRWHKRTETTLFNTGTVQNSFGYKFKFFDRPEGLLPKALAWIPQSTVAIVINLGLLNLWNFMRDDVQLLMQIHDSLVYQFPKTKLSLLPTIESHLRITVPYPDPLVIPISTKLSDKNWGSVKALSC